MQTGDVPAKSQRVFAQDATGTYKRTVPQTTADPAAASFSLGFPPNTFTDQSAGGTPPDGRDFNGLLNYLSGWARWVSAGAPIVYDTSFQSLIGGYPLGAMVKSAANQHVWYVSTVENNTSNPDAGGANWRVVVLYRATPAEVAAGTSDITLVTPKDLKDQGYDRVIAQNIAGYDGYRSFSSGFKECWGSVTVAANSATLVVNLPIPHSAWFNVSLGSFMRSTSDSQFNTAIISKNGLSGFTIQNNERIALQVDWSTRGV